MKVNLYLISFTIIYTHTHARAQNYIYNLNVAGRTLSIINENTQNAFEEYKKSFIAICYELYELGLRENDKRTEDVRLFEVVVNEGKENTQNEARR